MTLLFHHIQQLSRTVNQYLNEGLVQEDIYMSHWAVIYQLGENGRMTQAELKERLNIEAPPLSRTIKKLIKLGYVEKWASDDRRTNDLQLSAEGKENYPRWKSLIQEQENGLLTLFDEDQLMEFEERIHHFSQTIKTRGKNVE
ncbi:MarR family transcriptional regulator [Halobacillus salinarum]|uniref:MarR family transcriptional regulator n=1 Tax=Halobacillus salinarum TaxID=2932257 RepID=A0ABY4EL86_9BACI|nr:MarR family transcriptional regulator [Halobacillus salinarum]UOQ45231.1 MarR family transcriptional regulator [Halobacillus salinarum]